MKQLKYFTAILALAAFALALPVRAANIKRFFQDAKLPTQVMVEHQQWLAPALGTTNYIKTTYAGPTSAAAVTLTTFTAQPDVPRNIVITPTGTTGDVESCVITVNGTNMFDKVISEDFTFSADASTAVTGNKAFKTVTSVVWPANCESGGFAATWIIGTGSKLGLKRCLAQAGDVFHGVAAGVKEGTAPTIGASASALESNTASFNTALDGSKNFDLYFIQNYACMP